MSLASLARNDAEIITLQSRLLDHTGNVRPELSKQEADRLLGQINRARWDNDWSALDMEGRVPVPTDQVEWVSIGASLVPESRRLAFLAAITGQHWCGPDGTHPMSPGLALQTIIREFGIRPVEAVSYNVPWYAPDGPETATYTVLGVKTRKQRLIFVDTGTDVRAICILPA